MHLTLSEEGYKGKTKSRGFFLGEWNTHPQLSRINLTKDLLKRNFVIMGNVKHIQKRENSN